MRSIHAFVFALALGFVGVIAAATPHVNAAVDAKGCCADKAACTAIMADAKDHKGACCKEGAACCTKDGKGCCAGKDGAKCAMSKDGKSCCSPDMACCKDGTCCKPGGCCTMNKDKKAEPTAKADCCAPGAACCVPGAACCGTHG